jgi:hypothetical protein
VAVSGLSGTSNVQLGFGGVAALAAAALAVGVGAAAPWFCELWLSESGGMVSVDICAEAGWLRPAVMSNITAAEAIALHTRGPLDMQVARPAEFATIMIAHSLVLACRSPAVCLLDPTDRSRDQHVMLHCREHGGPYDIQQQIAMYENGDRQRPAKGGSSA